MRLDKQRTSINFHLNVFIPLLAKLLHDTGRNLGDASTGRYAIFRDGVSAREVERCSSAERERSPSRQRGGSPHLDALQSGQVRRERPLRQTLHDEHFAFEPGFNIGVSCFLKLLRGELGQAAQAALLPKDDELPIAQNQLGRAVDPGHFAAR